MPPQECGISRPAFKAASRTDSEVPTGMSRPAGRKWIVGIFCVGLLVISCWNIKVMRIFCHEIYCFRFGNDRNSARCG